MPPPLRITSHRPFYLRLGLCRSLDRRCFSHTSILGARQPSAPVPKTPAERSIRLIQQQQQEEQQMPSDLGLLPMTFITPTYKNLPSPFQSPLDFLKVQYKRCATRFRDQFSLLILKFSSPKEKGFMRRSVKLSRSTITPSALALHQQMYTSFAEGDIASLRKVCCDGLFDSFKARIGTRSRGEIVRWELVQYNKTAKLVSNRGATYPKQGASVRQAVVRISSRQKLTRLRNVNGNLGIVPGSGKEKDVVEYLVLQKLYDKWNEGPWQVWGTTRETTLEDLEDWQRQALE